jgi:acyl-CoA synthetase (AMP-forming)/AMP-acid ligase II
MSIGFLLERFAEKPERESLVWRDRVFDYRWLLDRIDHWGSELEARGVAPQTVVVLEGDYSPNSLALFLALVQRRCVVVPLTTEQSCGRRDEYSKVAEAEYLVRISVDDDVEFQALDRRAGHPLYQRLRETGHPALVLFSSGSSGPPKAAVHDFERLLQKYRTRRRDLRTLTFLVYDRIGGVDTLLYSLSNASCIVTVPDRLPETVCAAVQKYAVEVLPVSPSFLNLLILSQAYERYDLSSLQVITYGAEVMPEATLHRCHELFPRVQLLQKFGATEVGTLRSKSRAPDSTWVKIGGEGYGVRVVDGILQIKARSAILGYLNAPDPFTEDGWFITGDLVEVDGDYIRILGRETDVINVGGEKVNPAEVENVIQELPMVQEVAVFGEPNAILGNMVCARASLVSPQDPDDQRAVIRQIKSHCRRRLPPFKVPVRITIAEQRLITDRFKKVRRGLSEGSDELG